MLTQYLDKEIVTSLDLHLINGEVIKVQEHIKDAESKTLHIIHPKDRVVSCLLYTSPSPRDMRRSRMPSSA
ncbi:hypothetical protein JMUB7529_25260 [Staphylococcus aureus]